MQKHFETKIMFTESLANKEVYVTSVRALYELLLTSFFLENIYTLHLTFVHVIIRI